MAKMIDILRENAGELDVLLIVNDAQTRLTLANILKHYFHRVNVCAYGDDAMTVFESSKFDLIINDMSLPDMKGDVLCSNIKKITQTTPIVIVSRSKVPDALIRLINIGIDGFIELPLEKYNVLSILYEVVNKIIDRKSLYNFLDANMEDESTKNSLLENEELKETVSKSMSLLSVDVEEMSAKELMERYPIALETVGDKLLALNDRLDIYISKFVHDRSSVHTMAIASIFNQYTTVLRDMSYFINIMVSVKTIAETFEKVDSSKSFPTEYYDLMYAMSASLNVWCNDIFIEQTSPSVYFMDKSILADAIMIESLFLEKELNVDEVEFF